MPEQQNAIDSIKTSVVQKLLGQEMNTIMLVLLLAAWCYAFWWAMTTGVPAHLKQIQDGYREVAAEHSKAQTELQQTFEKTLDRIERKVTQHTVGKVDE
jgi:hypothetical protein